jgi:hypothetical protein
VMSPGRLCAPLGVSAAASGGTTAGASAGTAAVRRVDFGNLGPEPVADDTVARHRDEACREGTASSPRGGSVDINTELYGVASAVESGVGSANAFAFLSLVSGSGRCGSPAGGRKRNHDAACCMYHWLSVVMRVCSYNAAPEACLCLTEREMCYCATGNPGTTVHVVVAALVVLSQPMSCVYVYH